MAGVLARLKELHAEAASWLEEARAALAGAKGGYTVGSAAAAAAAAGGSGEAIKALLARDVLQAVQVWELPLCI